MCNLERDTVSQVQSVPSRFCQYGTPHNKSSVGPIHAYPHTDRYSRMRGCSGSRWNAPLHAAPSRHLSPQRAVHPAILSGCSNPVVEFNTRWILRIRSHQLDWSQWQAIALLIVIVNGWVGVYSLINSMFNFLQFPFRNASKSHERVTSDWDMSKMTLRLCFYPSVSCVYTSMLLY